MEKLMGSLTLWKKDKFNPRELIAGKPKSLPQSKETQGVPLG